MSSQLQPATLTQVKADLGIDLSPTVKTGADPEDDRKADAFVQALLTLDPKEVKAKSEGKGSVENIGLDLQRQAAKQSEMLQRPIHEMSAQAEDGGNVGNALVKLKMEVEQLDPAKFNFEPGWFSRTLGLLPFVGTPMKRYFTKFESSQTVISAIARSLETGRDQLGRDCTTLTEDQSRMSDITKKLEKAVAIAMLVDQKLEAKLKNEIPAGSDQHRFVSEELLFPLRQRVMDLQQQLAVNQQGVLATELVIRNNRELIRGVNRALNVTITALQVGATVAVALAHQKTVMDKVDNVNKTTSDLIANTAERLKTQGAAIHKQASSATLDIDKLKQAFADIKIAMDDISNFRTQALPQMANSVLEMDRLTAETKKTIEKMEQGNQMKPSLNLDI